MITRRSNIVIGTSALLIVLLPSAAGFIEFGSLSKRIPLTTSVRSSSSSTTRPLQQQLHMAQQSGFGVHQEASHHPHPLSAVAIETSSSAAAAYNDDEDNNNNNKKQDYNDANTSSSSSSSLSSLLQILSACCLITGNTVGAGCLVMPHLAAGPGLLSTIGVMGAAWLVNLMSGLVIAEVAIKQRESSSTTLASASAANSNNDDDVPSSFKEFAQVNLNEHAAMAVSGISVFVNACVMAFDLSQAGAVGHDLVPGINAAHVSMLWAGLVALLAATQSSQKLSLVASLCVAALFASFASLLVPGLAAVPQDPIATLLQPGIAASGEYWQSLSQAAPVMLMALIYQNIVPTIAKILDYDRTKTVVSIVLGSFVPLVMYLAYCYACLGGGIDTTTAVTGSTGGILMTVFSLATLSGSSLGSVMSLSEELDSYVQQSEKQQQTDKQDDDRFQLASVLMSVGVPLVVALTLANGEDFTAALTVAGSFGSPLLYGVIPALMCWRQRQQSTNVVPQENLVPAASLGVLGLLSTSFVGEELVQRVGEVLAYAS